MANNTRDTRLKRAGWGHVSGWLPPEHLASVRALIDASAPKAEEVAAMPVRGPAMTAVERQTAYRARKRAAAE